MKKILFIHHAKGWGGAPNSMIKLINELDSSKYETEVLLLKNSVVAEKLKENAIKYRIADSYFYKKLYRYFSHTEIGYVKWYQFFRFLKQLILWSLSRYCFAETELAKQKFDIVHLNSSVLTDWLAPAKKRGKVFIHIREPYHRGKFDILYPFFKKQMKKYADQIIAISKDNSIRIGLPEKTKVIYNSSEIPKITPNVHSYWSKKVLYLGGTAYIKGFYTLVNSLDYLDKDIIIYFGGSKTPLEKTNRIKFIIKKILGRDKKNIAIQKIKNNQNIKEIGMTNNLDKYLNEVCCLISPFSVSHFSRPVIEAHLQKKPAIVTDVDGIEEVIKHEENGLIVPKDNPKKLAEAINNLTSDGEKAKIYGENGYRVAIQKFTIKNTLQVSALYNKIMET